MDRRGPHTNHACAHQVHFLPIDSSLQQAFFAAKAICPYSSTTRIYATRGLRFVRVYTASGNGHTPSSSLNRRLRVLLAHDHSVSTIPRRVRCGAARSKETPFGRVSAINISFGGMASAYIGPVYSTTIIESVPTCKLWRLRKTSRSGRKIHKLIASNHPATLYLDSTRSRSCRSCPCTPQPPPTEGPPLAREFAPRAAPLLSPYI